MPYCTVEDLELRYGESTMDALALAAHQAGSEDDRDAVLENAIETADCIIDRELAGLYASQLPFSPVPLAVEKLSQELAYLTLRERAEGPTGYADQWKAAMALLEKWGSGKLPIIGVTRTRRLARSSVNDGRVSIAKQSHFDNDCNRIEGDDERTPLDVV